MTALPSDSDSGGLTIAEGPHALVVDIDAPELSTPDRHHLERVLLVCDGAPLTVGAGAVRWRACTFRS